MLTGSFRLMSAAIVCVTLHGQALAAGQTTLLHIQNLMCGADPHIIQGSLAALKGVAEIKISLENKTVTVSYDESQVSLEALLRAVGIAGYPATPQAAAVD
jgi:copper chaperone